MLIKLHFQLQQVQPMENTDHSNQHFLDLLNRAKTDLESVFGIRLMDKPILSLPQMNILKNNGWLL